MDKPFVTRRVSGFSGLEMSPDQFVKLNPAAGTPASVTLLLGAYPSWLLVKLTVPLPVTKVLIGSSAVKAATSDVIEPEVFETTTR